MTTPKGAGPPKLFLRLFRWYCHPILLDRIEGDLLELYASRLRQSGKAVADRLFIKDVVLLFRPGIIRPFQYTQINTAGMYKSYFKIAWRNLMNNKGYSFINITGLAVGMTVAMLIGLWILDEVTFDSSFANRDRLAQVMINQTHEGVIYTGGTVQMPLGDALRTNYASDFEAVSLISWESTFMLSQGEHKLPGRGRWVEKKFPDMFSLQMLSGNADALKNPTSLLMASSLAKALFGDENPLGKSLRLDNRFDMVVSGVYEDFPHNSTFNETRMLLAWDNKENWMNTQTENWMNHCGQLFVQLNSNADIQLVNEKIRSVPTPHISQWKEELMLHPLADLHLYNEYENGKLSGGRIRFVWLFGIIGVFVLMLACINFMNLATARSGKRAKEVGIRKTIGSVRSQLINQFLSESVVVTTLSFVIALILLQISLSQFNMLADKQIMVPWSNPLFWMVMLCFTLFTGILSGSYPAFYLSAFKPGRILKGTFIAGRLAALPRKVLVVVQFTVSLTLIIGTLIVFKQIQFARERAAGYNRDGLITIEMNTPEVRKNIDVIRNDLLNNNVIESLALSSQSPAHFSNNNGLEWRGKDPGVAAFFRNVGVNAEFGKTVGWTIKSGRDFSADLPGDSASIIINENAASLIGFEDPIGEVLEFRGKKFTVIGVVHDMLTQSPYASSEPSFFITDDWMRLIVIRLNPEIPVQQALAEAGKIFKKYNPESAFEYSFVNADYAKKFANEERVGKLAGLFAVLAILISCLGLFGLAAFIAEQRTKEIGIRKVLGASVTGICRMLSKDFLVLVIIASCISVPLAFFFMNDWLTQYEYRIALTWDLFALAAIGTVVLTLLTVSFQALKAALANPVRNLRSE